MNPLAALLDWLRARLTLAAKRREIARLEHEIWQSKDWMAQAERVLAEQEERLHRLQAEADLVTPADELVRRAGVA